MLLLLESEFIQRVPMGLVSLRFPGKFTDSVLRCSELQNTLSLSTKQDALSFPVKFVVFPFTLSTTFDVDTGLAVIARVFIWGLNRTGTVCRRDASCAFQGDPDRETATITLGRGRVGHPLSEYSSTSYSAVGVSGCDD